MKLRAAKQKLDRCDEAGLKNPKVFKFFFARNSELTECYSVTFPTFVWNRAPMKRQASLIHTSVGALYGFMSSVERSYFSGLAGDEH